MKRSHPEAAEVHLNFGTTPPDSPRTSSDFEEIHYPHTDASSNASFGWTAHSQHDEDLPLYNMNEEKARRRVPHANSGSDAFPAYVEGPDVYDDEGKDVYAKMRTSKMPTGSGRPRRPPPPPATTIVRVLLLGLFYACALTPRPSRASSCSKTSSTYHL